MPIPLAALDLELRSLGKSGQATLGAAFQILLQAWQRGDRERELGLHLSFLAWYLAVEPTYLTGRDSITHDDDLIAVFHQAHAFLLPGGAASTDAEALYAIGLAAHVFPWVFADGDPVRLAEWTGRAAEYRSRYRALLPHGIPPSTFDGRGAYGEYFAGQSRVVGGY